MASSSIFTTQSQGTNSVGLPTVFDINADGLGIGRRAVVKKLGTGTSPDAISEEFA